MFFKIFYMVISSLLIFNPIMSLKEMILDGTGAQGKDFAVGWKAYNVFYWKWYCGEAN